MMETVPIASLESLGDTTTKQIRGLVSLVWPFSSSTRRAAFLLVEPDFRLRSKKGQVRVQVQGPAALAVAQSKLGIGDEVILNLQHVKRVEAANGISTPGRSVDLELVYGHHLDLQISRQGGVVNHVEVNEPMSMANEQVSSTTFEQPETPRPLTPIPPYLLRQTPKPVPIFHQRARSSAGSAVDSLLDPFGADDIEIVRQHKRPRLSWGTPTKWKVLKQTPSPEDPTVEDTQDALSLFAQNDQSSSSRSPPHSNVQSVASSPSVHAAQVLEPVQLHEQDQNPDADERMSDSDHGTSFVPFKDPPLLAKSRPKQTFQILEDASSLPPASVQESRIDSHDDPEPHPVHIGSSAVQTSHEVIEVSSDSDSDSSSPSQQGIRAVSQSPVMSVSQGEREGEIITASTADVLDDINPVVAETSFLEDFATTQPQAQPTFENVQISQLPKTAEQLDTMTSNPALLIAESAVLEAVTVPPIDEHAATYRSNIDHHPFGMQAQHTSLAELTNSSLTGTIASASNPAQSTSEHMSSFDNDSFQAPGRHNRIPDYMFGFGFSMARNATNTDVASAIETSFSKDATSLIDAASFSEAVATTSPLLSEVIGSHAIIPLSEDALMEVDFPSTGNDSTQQPAVVSQEDILTHVTDSEQNSHEHVSSAHTSYHQHEGQGQPTGSTLDSSTSVVSTSFASAAGSYGLIPRVDNASMSFVPNMGAEGVSNISDLAPDIEDAMNILAEQPRLVLQPDYERQQEAAMVEDVAMDRRDEADAGQEQIMIMSEKSRSSNLSIAHEFKRYEVDEVNQTEDVAVIRHHDHDVPKSREESLEHSNTVPVIDKPVSPQIAVQDVLYPDLSAHLQSFPGESDTAGSAANIANASTWEQVQPAPPTQSLPDGQRSPQAPAQSKIAQPDTHISRASSEESSIVADDEPRGHHDQNPSQPKSPAIDIVQRKVEPVRQETPRATDQPGSSQPPASTRFPAAVDIMRFFGASGGVARSSHQSSTQTQVALYPANSTIAPAPSSTAIESSPRRAPRRPGEIRKSSKLPAASLADPVDQQSDTSKSVPISNRSIQSSSSQQHEEGAKSTAEHVLHDTVLQSVEPVQEPDSSATMSQKRIEQIEQSSEQEDEVAEDNLTSTMTLSQQAPFAQSKIDEAAEQPQLGIRTSYSYYVPLANLSDYLNQPSAFDSTIDVLAVVYRATSDAVKADKGRRDWFTKMRVTQPGFWRNTTLVQIFRGYKSAVPRAEPGDVILLRCFQVTGNKKGGVALKSSDGSAWCVFKAASETGESASGSDSDEDHAKNEIMTGPPAEYGKQERQAAKEMHRWWAESQQEADHKRKSSGSKL